MAALPLQATVTWVVAKTALGAGRGGVTVHAMVVPLPPGSLATVLPAALVARSWLTCVVSVCSLCVTCAFHPLTSVVLAITLVLGSAPPAAAAGLVTVRSPVPQWFPLPDAQGSGFMITIVLAATLAAAPATDAWTGPAGDPFTKVPPEVCGNVTVTVWVAVNLAGGLLVVSNS